MQLPPAALHELPTSEDAADVDGEHDVEPYPSPASADATTVSDPSTRKASPVLVMSV
jgi:hypothetical protein